MPTPPTNDRGPDSADISELCEALSDAHRRRVLYYLRDHDGTVSVDELREHLSKQTEADTDGDITVLHHATLPKLNDFEMIEYDVDGGDVRYVGTPLTTELLEWMWKREPTES